MLAYVTGDWNAETAKAYKHSINKAIETINDKSWAIISNVDQWELCAPDCELLMILLVAEYRDKNLKREAIVNNTKSVKIELFHKNSKINSTINRPDVF